MIDLPAAKAVYANPSHEELRDWALAYMPRVTVTEFGNLNYKAEVTARLSRSTFFVTEDPSNPQNTVSRAEYDHWAALQDGYIAGREMILVEGYIGPERSYRTGSRLFIEKTQANIAGMQRQLYFPPDDAWEPTFTVIYTPGLPAPGKPDDRLILVDLENYVTRVLGSDYFGESKMGGLRMWNHYVYERGGLALHSGLKVFPDSGNETSLLVLGLSGTGKTTTTFRQQLGSLPVQDDFTALFPGGRIWTTEAGCFAKTYGLDPDDEPTIHHGTTRPDAWLENTFVAPDGSVDFFDDSHTANGRSTFPLANIRHRDPAGVPPVRYLLLLNRNETIVPAVAKLRRDQVVAYFMLGETKGTSAGGAAEEGKSLRVPGTNPFFFDDDALQGLRLAELLATMPDVEVFVLNTGRVGGAGEESKKVEIAHSSAVVEAVVSGKISWEEDPDFGYLVATDVAGIEDRELLEPRRLYERTGRRGEYAELVARLREERRRYLAGYEHLPAELAVAI